MAKNLTRKKKIIRSTIVISAIIAICVLAYYIYPTIDEKPIYRYFDENNNIQYSGIKFNVRIVEFQKKYAKDLACKIACLCDHYKTR